MSKLLDPINEQRGDLRNDEAFFQKYFDFKQVTEKPVKKRVAEEDGESDIDEYADELFEQEMQQMNQEEIDFDDEEFEDFIESIDEEE